MFRVPKKDHQFDKLPYVALGNHSRYDRITTCIRKEFRFLKALLYCFVIYLARLYEKTCTEVPEGMSLPARGSL